MADQKITELTEDTSPAIDDLLVTVDTSASDNKKVQASNLLKIINGLTEDTATSYPNDFVLTYDASASSPKKVKPSTLVPINIGFTALGAVLTSSEVIGKWVATEAFTLPASLTGSRAHAEAASTGTAVIDLAKNGSNFGTVTFTASATGVLAAASSTSFSAGDRLTATGPASADATLAGIAISLKGTRD